MPKKTDITQTTSNKSAKPLASKLVGRLLLVLGLSVMLTSQLASGVMAFSQTNGKESPHDRARSYTYFKALDTCAGSDLFEDVITTSVESDRSTSTSTWFKSNGPYLNDHHVFPEGTSNCGEVAYRALQLWGWDSNAQFLEDMGYKFSTDVQYGLPGFKASATSQKAGLHGAVARKIGGIPSGQKDALYNIYLWTFKKECDAKPIGLYTELNDTQKELVDANKKHTDGKYYTRITTATAEGEDSKTVSQGWTHNGKKNNLVWGHRDTGPRLDCTQLAKDISSTAPDFRVWNINNPDHPHANGEGLDMDNEAEEEVNTCQIDGIGWIVCPVVNFLALLVDASYAFVASLLSVQPLTTDSSSSLYGAWSIMRNFANVAFVIAFMIIIFSQVSSIGITNYGIKKLLPRLIAAAILVNISYWICAIAVDISNILGHSLMDLFSSIGASIPAAPNSTSIGTGAGWAGIVGAVLAGGVIIGGLIYIGLASLLPVLLAVGLAIVTVFLVLILRQALIILLIVVAPLAFVAFLLPNTEGLFKKWLALFRTMLLMFPIIALIFGASALASQIVMNSAEGDYKIVIQIAGAGIAIIPLAITPLVMKTAGGLLNRIGGFVNNPNRGPIDRLRRGAEGIRDSRKSLMRARRLNGEGGNKFTRSARRAMGSPDRLAMRMKSGADRNKAREEAAEAGYNLSSTAANEAAQIRMAASAAGSARQSAAVQDITSEGQLAALGVSDTGNASLNAAIRGQIQSGERQAISEVEAEIAPQSATQLGETLKKAIQEGDIFTAQAAQNRLSGMGNKGAGVMADAIMEREEPGRNNKNWAQMRTELARNLDGNMMQKDEALKNWAVRTEINQQGELRDEDGNNTDVSLKARRQELLQGESLSLDKFMKQTPAVQKAILGDQQAQESAGIISKGDQPVPSNVSKEMLQTALSDQNVKAFDPKVVEMIQNNIAGTQAPPAQSGGGSIQSSAVSAPTDLKIHHGPTGAPAPAAAPAQQQAPTSVQKTPAASGPVTNNVTITNNNQNNITSNPTSPTNFGVGSDPVNTTYKVQSYTDKQGRQIPGGVTNPDDYIDRMSK